jgi:hypothetical protein
MLTDLEHAQAALPEPKRNSGVFEKIGIATFKRVNAITVDDGITMFLAGMAKAREIDAHCPQLRGEQIVDLWEQSKGSKYERWDEKFITFARAIEAAIRLQEKKY